MLVLVGGRESEGVLREEEGRTIVMLLSNRRPDASVRTAQIGHQLRSSSTSAHATLTRLNRYWQAVPLPTPRIQQDPNLGLNLLRASAPPVLSSRKRERTHLDDRRIQPPTKPPQPVRHLLGKLINRLNHKDARLQRRSSVPTRRRRRRSSLRCRGYDGGRTGLGARSGRPHLPLSALGFRVGGARAFGGAGEVRGRCCCCWRGGTVGRGRVGEGEFSRDGWGCWDGGERV